MTSEQLTTEQLEALLNATSASTEPADLGLGPSFLHLLATAGRQLLSKLLTEHSYQPGHIIFKEGEPGDTMYIIWSGRVAIIKGSYESPTVLGFRGVGEIIGEMALLEDQPRSATVIALEDLRTLRIRREDFEQWLSQNPTMGLSILGTLSARLRAADDARKSSSRAEHQLSQQVINLKTENQQLVELERLRQSTVDLIVHDLRHPISSLFGAIKILEMVLPEDVLQTNQQLLDIANANCDHLQLMVESLLDVARMEANDPNLKLSQTDLAQLIREAIQRLTIFVDIENISVETHLPDDLPKLQADREKIYRVMSNLINNAIKYTPSRGKITIAAELQDDHILICVTDTGPGIAPEDREHIFNRFAQVAIDKARAGGFGLGLAFCRMAVEAHGGRIWVETGEDGAGSRFIFTLPLSPPNPANGDSQNSSESLLTAQA
jgi:signal transduction histidine kinase